MADTMQNDESRNPPGPEENEEEEQLFDLLIPPGVPRKMIADILKKFEVDLVARKERLYFANMDGDERELLAFRGKKEVMEEVQTYLYNELKKFIGE
ncbi:MAG TPA: hypothetical protein PLN56_06265 [Methanoregulaceae archaeon]|nr:hypothetical protein [Methanoregulaceae archaeon]HPD10581.1 hypothetical protein [Methanoregulaceae archaeon]HRT15570.1 hypothetical protein [Methanoregulaceae archaeon]HRU31142.1 hypothetical protein [Methanoregulaceae archaeon]